MIQLLRCAITSRGVCAPLLLLAFVLVTHVPAPWKHDVINDEMHHLESWRNRYGTNDIYPMFLERLESSGRLSAERMAQVRSIYHLHPLVQRGLIVLVDPQPPLYPVLAEMTQWLTDSSLVLLRWWSLLFSLGAVYGAYWLGRAVWDDAAGVWVAVLASIGATTQFYAGIGRPYALTQLVILLALWAYVARVRGRISLRRFLGACLLAQAVQWIAWAVVGPLVAFELARSWRAGERLKGLWWYAPGSALLLGYMLVQLQNPTVSNQGGVRSPWQVWWCYAVAGPFSHLGSFGDAALYAGAAVFAALTLCGAFFLLQRDDARWLSWGFVASAGCGVLAALTIGVEVRFAVSYITPAVLLAGIGARSISDLRMSGSGWPVAGATSVMLGFGAMAIWHPEDPYERIDQYDVPWSQVAETLKRELKPGETWVAYPPNVANNVYRYGPLPEPIAPLQPVEFERVVADNPGICAIIERGNSDSVVVSPLGQPNSRFAVGRVVAVGQHSSHHR